MATYEVDFFYSSPERPEVYDKRVTHHAVSGIPDYLLGEAAVGHITARLLHDNPAFKRIRGLRIHDKLVSVASIATTDH